MVRLRRMEIDLLSIVIRRDQRVSLVASVLNNSLNKPREIVLT